MRNNFVRLYGTVKRDADAAIMGVIDFALVVESEGRNDIIDCRTTSQSEAWEQLDGFVNGGEFLGVEGHLMRRTTTERARVAGTAIEAKNTVTMVYVDRILTTEEDQ